MKTGLYTGTFDPFTTGHQNIVMRALPLFDRLVIAVAVSELKHTQEEIGQRVRDIQALYAEEPKIKVVSYQDLTIDLAQREQAQYIVRGVRNLRDFEYEREQADINKQLGGVETLLFFSDPKLESVSSTLVRELRHFGHDAHEFLPEKDKNK
ncbi:MAG: pantetheine-phosphate adenylyltransferase [Prevotella sp.]|jgi:pantetheine-phosphate adenylyltransferase|nr:MULTISPECIES: pantetheine-phosphate adenylyltransferase [unclassified Prevotella]MCH3969516.1 pantetheine-phosphate adenylyltransferase [Prevotella sp.]MCH3991734.1 pantetheine-phosphate adenylyltransferase [Prevotella sp.]MCH4018894.1 pantetheine-phosphate adenylyltransferase [Prevotella sp.]MCH4099493.1 pantetheine-phosphate adenylyltransferase [Prevotella sp.]MCH4215589.1 pantetheine-phosphate adenylyltransferase [Prevotella sp.]